jgi:hypothetical protein
MAIKELVQGFNSKCIGWTLGAKQKLRGVMDDERGDTNFISIIVILGIALGVAAIFIGFKDQIVGAATTIIENFLGIFGS